MSHFLENKFSREPNRKRLKCKLFRVDLLKVKSITIFFLESQNNLAFVKLLPKIFELIIQLVLLKLEEVISIIENYDHHFVFYFFQLYLSVIVKFSDLVKLVSKDIFVLNPIKIDVKVKLKCSPLYEVSDAFKNKRCTTNTNRTINYVYVLA